MKKLISLLVVIILIDACKKNSTPDPVPGPVKPLTDIDGNGYDTIKICTQFWMKQNLNTSHYRNGDPIPQVQTDWTSQTSGAWCWYKNDSATYAQTYGKLYNWYAFMDPRGLAPAGWHVPSDDDWNKLSTCLGGYRFAGGAMKETGTTHWDSPNTGATNSSRFTGLPGGFRAIDGHFASNGRVSFWWSSTLINTPTYSSIFSLHSFDDGLSSGFGAWKDGLSVRCVKD